MNRRSFFNSLSAAVVGCYMAMRVNFDDVKVAINPALQDTVHEVRFLVSDYACGVPEQWISYKA